MGRDAGACRGDGARTAALVSIAPMLRGLTKPTARPGAGLPASLRGALWMGAAAVAFALMVTLVRQLTDGLHPLQVVFFRTAFGLAAMLLAAVLAENVDNPFTIEIGEAFCGQELLERQVGERCTALFDGLQQTAVG